MVGGKHDFVDNGFTGGGVCAACHVPHGAGDSRLWPRVGDSASYPTAPLRQCMDCHDGSMPTGSGWPDPWPGPPPPPPGAHIGDVAGDHAALSCRDQGQQNCGSCHLHQEGFTMVEGCFDCHTTVAQAELIRGAGNALFPDATEQCMQTDREFDGLGVDDAQIPLLSQHNVAAGAVDCQKCHGSGHPGDDGLLAYPDNVGTHLLGDAVPRSANLADYQDFCLACHDGQDESTNPVPDTTFTGSPTANQVAPSEPTDPAALQASQPWVVPAVPAKTSVGAVTQPPYFAFYETNGHGADTALISSSPMNVTCLAGGTGQGCHAAHGTQNRYLIDDSVLGTGIDSVAEFGTDVCYGCHLVGVNFGDAGSVSLFHNFSGNGTVLHDNSIDTASAPDGMAQMRLLPFNSTSNLYYMNITSFVTAMGAMPFYEGSEEANKIHQRSYPGTLSTSNWVHCLTCHDPHGTGPGGTGTLPPDEPGMLRRYPTTQGYDDALCGQCHVR